MNGRTYFPQNPRKRGKRHRHNTNASSYQTAMSATNQARRKTKDGYNRHNQTEMLLPL